LADRIRGAGQLFAGAQGAFALGRFTGVAIMKFVKARCLSGVLDLVSRVSAYGDKVDLLGHQNTITNKEGEQEWGTAGYERVREGKNFTQGRDYSRDFRVEGVEPVSSRARRVLYFQGYRMFKPQFDLTFQFQNYDSLHAKCSYCSLSAFWKRYMKQGNSPPVDPDKAGKDVYRSDLEVLM
jgi:hypothetical protein